jgi:hypothetical protein
MTMPGFTAEASLYNGDARYQTTAEAVELSDLRNLMCSTRIGRSPTYAVGAMVAGG